MPLAEVCHDPLLFRTVRVTESILEIGPREFVISAVFQHGQMAEWHKEVLKTELEIHIYYKKNSAAARAP